MVQNTELNYYSDWVFTNKIPSNISNHYYILLIENKENNKYFKKAELINWHIDLENEERIIAYLELPNPNELYLTIQNPDCKSCETCEYLIDSQIHGIYCEKLSDNDMLNYQKYGNCPKHKLYKNTY